MKGKPWFIKLLKLALTKSLAPRMAALPKGLEGTRALLSSSCWLAAVQHTGRAVLEFQHIHDTDSLALAGQSGRL